MKGCLRIVIPIITLLAVTIYYVCPRPTRDEAQLKAIVAESQHLMATYRLGPAVQSTDIPKRMWPPAIANLEPYSVTVHRGMVDITIKPSFDGGSGYGFALNKKDLTMPAKCWSELGHGVYWHGPC